MSKYKMSVHGTREKLLELDGGQGEHANQEVGNKGRKGQAAL